MHREFEKLTLERIEAILSQRHSEGFLSLKDLPQPQLFKDMDRASKRIAEAIKDSQNITIIGDYDVDGVSATAIMRLFFQDLGYPVNWIIPNRFRHGYGLSPKLIPEIPKSDLIITVDNGISAVEASKICADMGIDLIITDHHIVPKESPKAYAIINQKQTDCNFPYPEICGAQIAWYLCASIKNELGVDIDMKKYLQIVALAIIADIMPLNGINRAMVISGLKILSKSSMPFVQAYRELKGVNSFKSEDIAFFLAPILNSAGRLEDASLACNYICSSDIFEARRALSKLIDMNERRKSLEADITEEAISIANPKDSVQIIVGKDWHEGVIGIVAARVARYFERPTIILTKNGDEYKGSGRSFGDCNLFELVDSAREYMSRFGGHKAAVGLSLPIENIDKFRAKLIESAKLLCENSRYEDPDIIGELELSDIDDELYYLIERFEPFGEANPKPKFISRGVEILNRKEMGSEGNHMSFDFSQNRVVLRGVKFKISESEKASLYSGSRADIVYTISENIFNDNRTLQLMIDKITIIN